MSGAPPNHGCEDAVRRLDAYLANQLETADRREVSRHLETCALCTAELSARRRVREQLQSAVRATQAPPGLEAKVRSVVRSRAASPRTGLWAVAAAAAVIVCIGLAGLWRARSDPEETILRKASGRLAAVLSVGLRDHLQCAVFRKYSKEPVPDSQMAAELGPRFAGLAPLIQAKLPAGFRIIQGHQCSAGGRSYTHLIVSGGGKLVSVILTRRLPGEAFGGGIHQAGVDRFQVVGFDAQGYLAYVVSDVDPGESLQWAANLAPTLREYLDAHAG
ncbi:MAG TPA: zf-HC2 domain-containing protein [Bryobacteraceae bacterium]|nr:zf-HC2 domain-containing protein [Bryobacteraceae bacterium]